MPSGDPISPRAVLSRDTDRAAEHLQLRLLRGMSPGTRLQAAVAATSASLRLCLVGIRRRHSSADEGARFLSYARIRLGAEEPRSTLDVDFMVPPTGPPSATAFRCPLALQLSRFSALRIQHSALSTQHFTCDHPALLCPQQQRCDQLGTYWLGHVARGQVE